jgi:hypothetical protein
VGIGKMLLKAKLIKTISESVNHALLAKTKAAPERAGFLVTKKPD